MSEINEIFKLIGTVIAFVLGIFGILTVLVIMISGVPIDKQVEALLNLLIPTEASIAQFLIGFGTAGALLAVFIFWFFHNYVK
jgi:hypothetical protein